VRDVFSLDPVLVSDGAVNPGAADHRLSRRSGACTGIGMVEPGHFVTIVADGRQPGYSVGMLLDEFARLFVDEGCAFAYNLDGGVSACMVFMGEQINRHGDKRAGTDQIPTSAVCRTALCGVTPSRCRAWTIRPTPARARRRNAGSVCMIRGT